MLDTVFQAIDPVGTYIFGQEAGTGSAFYGPSSSGASGGFVLYPSKPNLNMMGQVYAK